MLTKEVLERQAEVHPPVDDVLLCAPCAAVRRASISQLSGTILDARRPLVVSPRRKSSSVQENPKDAGPGIALAGALSFLISIIGQVEPFPLAGRETASHAVAGKGNKFLRCSKNPDDLYLFVTSCDCNLSPIRAEAWRHDSWLVV